MIRNDQLPDIRTVITADLDLRDLYRNQWQTVTDDLQAELYSNSPPSYEEVQRLLHEALAAAEGWFALIEAKDVYEAETKVQEQQHLFSNYS